VMSLFSNDVQPITVVMLLDRSGSMRPNFDLEEQAGEAFVAAMGAADKARIGSFSNRIEVDPEDYTSDHEKLRHIIRHELQDEGPTPLWNAVNVGITDLLHQQGRRVVLVFTDGVDPDIPVEDDPSQLAKGTDPQLQRAIQEVTTRMKALPPKAAQPPYEKRTPGSGQ